MQLSENELKKLQQTELEIFKSFVSVCKTLGIRYYLVAGTLLGAVRHKGFIPWDDDIDVGIPREDYEIFIEKADKLLPPHLFVQSFKKDKGYHQPFGKIRNSDTAFIELSVKDNPMNHGVYIDIFPLDKCDLSVRNSKAFRIRESIYKLRISCLAKNCKLSLKARVARLICALVCYSPHKALCKLEKLYKSMTDGNMLVNFGGIYGDREIMPSEWYAEGAIVEFEGISVSVPKEYDKVLEKLYGDYMTPPPPEKRITLHQTCVIDTERSYKEYIKK